jgi:dienelactone hydrolase
MRLNQLKKRVLLIMMVTLSFFLSACDDDLREGVCTTQVGLESGEYQSAAICYPCEMGEEDYPAVAISGGFSNTKEQMQDYAEELVANGFIVIGVTPKGNYSTNHSYFQRALTEAFNKLKAHDVNPESPIYGKVDEDRMAQVGYSMGGGAILLNAQSDTGDIKAAVGICPYYPAVKPTSFNTISTPIMLLTGSADTVASPNNVVKMKDSILSGDHDRVVFANLEGVAHLDPVEGMGSSENHARIMEYTVAFLKSELQGDVLSEMVIAGDIQAQHEQDGWFRLYELL